MRFQCLRFTCQRCSTALLVYLCNCTVLGSLFMNWNRMKFLAPFSTSCLGDVSFVRSSFASTNSRHKFAWLLPCLITFSLLTTGSARRLKKNRKEQGHLNGISSFHRPTQQNIASPRIRIRLGVCYRGDNDDASPVHPVDAVAPIVSAPPFIWLTGLDIWVLHCSMHETRLCIS